MEALGEVAAEVGEVTVNSNSNRENMTERNLMV